MQCTRRVINEKSVKNLGSLSLSFFFLYVRVINCVHIYVATVLVYCYIVYGFVLMLRVVFYYRLYGLAGVMLPKIRNYRSYCIRTILLLSDLQKKLCGLWVTRSHQVSSLRLPKYPLYLGLVLVSIFVKFSRNLARSL